MQADDKTEVFMGKNEGLEISLCLLLVILNQESHMKCICRCLVESLYKKIINTAWLKPVVIIICIIVSSSP